jgi:hypothetical protein
MLFMALDDRSISYLRSTVQIVVDSTTGEELRQRLADLGVQTTIRDQY